MDNQPDSPVVVGVDGSPSSDLAIEWAADAAQLRRRPLKMVYVMDFPGPRVAYDLVSGELSTFAQDLLLRAQARARARHAALPTATAIMLDDATHALIRESEHAAMIVVGNRGHGGFHDLVLGSTSLQTAMHAACPVAVIRPRLAPAEPGVRSYGRIVLGVDGSRRSAAATQLAFEEADLRGIGLTAVNAWLGALAEGSVGMPLARESEVLESGARTLLEQATAQWCAQYPNVDVRRIAVQGPAAAVLVDHSMGAEMVVVGCRGHGGFTGMLLGSVSQAVIHHAGCPVMVAHEASARHTPPV